MELKKQMTWSAQRSFMYHYRTHGQKKVDIILEAPDSRFVAIEVKLASSVNPKDFAGIDSFREDVGDFFHRGIVFYMGEKNSSLWARKVCCNLTYFMGKRIRPCYKKSLGNFISIPCGQAKLFFLYHSHPENFCF